MTVWSPVLLTWKPWIKWLWVGESAAPLNRTGSAWREVCRQQGAQWPSGCDTSSTWFLNCLVLIDFSPPFDCVRVFERMFISSVPLLSITEAGDWGQEERENERPNRNPDSYLPSWMGSTVRIIVFIYRFSLITRDFLGVPHQKHFHVWGPKAALSVRISLLTCIRCLACVRHCSGAFMRINT